MTWGEQNTPEEAFAQMDLALEAGINFFDTAEMYPIDARAETYGRTEEIIGEWFTARGKRQDVILATKVVGPGSRFGYIRDGKPRLNAAHITEAVEASLRRLQTDVIDLYQLHWPDRPMHVFGTLGFRQAASGSETPLEETLDVLEGLIRAGKLRAVGVSNETPWGVMRAIALAEAGKGPRMASIQNPYSLLNRSFEARLAEVAVREDCGLLAYAPIAAGALTGKYLGGKNPERARFTLWPLNRRYRSPQGEAATRAYVDLAQKNGLAPAQMALAFVLAQPFVTSALIGATSLAQLKSHLEAGALRLSEELLTELEEIHKIYTYPCP
jgi:aryl-alcohol dehydrogenase-like predicted oxidoreductase